MSTQHAQRQKPKANGSSSSYTHLKPYVDAAAAAARAPLRIDSLCVGQDNVHARRAASARCEAAAAASSRRTAMVNARRDGIHAATSVLQQRGGGGGLRRPVCLHSILPTRTDPLLSGTGGCVLLRAARVSHIGTCGDETAGPRCRRRVWPMTGAGRAAASF